MRARRMSILRAISVTLGLSLAAAAPALAQEVRPDQCTVVGFFEDVNELHAAVVAGSHNEKVLFQSSKDGGACPSTNLKRCPRDRYLIPSNQVILNGETRKEFACAWYYSEGAHSELAGWIPKENLTQKDAAATTPKQWAGEWELMEDPKAASFTMTIDGNRIEYTGDALSNLDSPMGPNTGNVSGAFSGTAKPPLTLNGGIPPCQLKLWLFEPFLVAEDNGSCGGMNVSFDGIYRKK